MGYFAFSPTCVWKDFLRIEAWYKRLQWSAVVAALNGCHAVYAFMWLRTAAGNIKTPGKCTLWVLQPRSGDPQGCGEGPPPHLAAVIAW